MATHRVESTSMLVMLLLALAGCREKAATAPPEPARPVVPSPAAADTRLPEDPVQGKRSEEQWKEHLEEEEHERQIAFDAQRIPEHRAVVQLVSAARARYDAATTVEAVTRARSDVGGRVKELRKKVTELDHWGVNSRLLPDYAAFEAMLEKDYPDAKAAALKGDSRPLEEARSRFEAHMKTVEAWLEEAQSNDGEAERDEESAGDRRATAEKGEKLR
jgi:hypothetical protein